MMIQKTVPGVLLGLFLLSVSASQAGEPVIIKCAGGCDAAADSVLAAGGSITYRYKYVDAIAATVPAQLFDRGSNLQGVERVLKDLVIDAPQAVESVTLEDDFVVLDSAALELSPQDYNESVALTGVGPLFAGGHLGDGVKVAVIDSGTAPVSAFGRGGCSVTDPTVIGGETFIAAAGPTEPSATSTLNGSHGTQVGTQIAANTIFGFANAAVISQSTVAHSPSSAIVDIVPGVTGIPMVGTAPCAQIYALKTFPASGGGAPRSDIAAAMERAIELRENFNNGVPSAPVSGSGTAADPYVYDSLKIDVVNMSLGGPTTYAGYEITDQLTLKMLEVGITVVNSAGNAGHAAMTGGSAGTGFGTLTAGAANLTHNERILRDVQFGLGIGALYRASDHHQVADFSSRGPSADGRINVDAVAGGLANLAQSPTGGIGLVSGTSFSAPTIAGAAAVLHGALPGVSALQVRNALVETADPDVLGDNSAPIDRGHGFINVAAAYQALVNGQVSNKLPSGPESNAVRGNIASLGIKTLQAKGRGTRETINGLVPGQVAHFFVNTTTETEAIVIRLSNIRPELPPEEQNFFFGDDLFVLVQDAITSTDAVLDGGFIADDTALVALNPQSGILRIAVMGDWTNAGRISADIEIQEFSGRKLKNSARDRVREGDALFYSVTVPNGTGQASFELQWQQDWGRYPTDDLDLIILTPGGDVVVDGATLNSPERAVIDNPVPGEYIVIVDGYTVWGKRGSQAQFSLHAFDDAGRGFKTKEL
ncbi:MAG TPA: S8 family serine peptidase [Gammaproteobacteria bacterium]|nr:S8 family serine peptidase [Gammaproteobacteria bacterium]HRP86837.1 S8 family serine peptidase [Gammaproteobacteria bacterium]